MEYDKKEFEELLILYALDELEPEEVAAVEEELQKRPELAAQVEKVRRTDGLLADVFAQSDEVAQQAPADESVKPMIAGNMEKPQRHLARRFMISVAALAMVLVVGVLLYPQLINNDVYVAMNNPEEPTGDKPATTRPEAAGVKQEEVIEQEGEIEIAEDVPAPTAQEPPASEVAQPAQKPQVHKNPAPGSRRSNPKAVLAEEDQDDVPSTDEEDIPVLDLNGLMAGQMNKQVGVGQNAQPKTDYNNGSDSVPESYATLRKLVLDENQLPSPENVNVKQWLNYFGISESDKTTDNHDAQFAKAVNRFGELLSSSAPAEVKDFENVLGLLKESVGDDPKRQEFKSIVEKTIELKKRSE